MELLIREVQVDDAEAIVSILNPIIQAGIYTAFDTPFTVEAEREYILNFPQRGVFHVAICDGREANRLRHRDRQVVGFQSMEPFATYTHAFDHVGVLGTYVDLSYRRQGIARRLFTAMFEAARLKGYEKLFTFIRADNPAALTTYLNQGFQIVGTAKTHAKIDRTYVDEIIVERFL